MMKLRLLLTITFVRNNQSHIRLRTHGLSTTSACLASIKCTQKLDGWDLYATQRRLAGIAL